MKLEEITTPQTGLGLEISSLTALEQLAQDYVDICGYSMKDALEAAEMAFMLE